MSPKRRWLQRRLWCPTVNLDTRGRGRKPKFPRSYRRPIVSPTIRTLHINSNSNPTNILPTNQHPTDQRGGLPARRRPHLFQHRLLPVGRPHPSGRIHVTSAERQPSLQPLPTRPLESPTRNLQSPPSVCRRTRSTTWVSTPPTASPFSHSDLIDLSHSVAPPAHSHCGSYPSTGSSQYVGFPFSPPYYGGPPSNPFAPPHHHYPIMHGRPDTSGLPGSQSSIVCNDSPTTTYGQSDVQLQRDSPIYSQSKDQTAALSDDHLHISACIQVPEPAESVASTTMSSLTTPLSADSSSTSNYHSTLADAIDELTLSDYYNTGGADFFGNVPTSVASHHSGLTVPQTGRGITRAPLHPHDYGLYTRNFFPPRIPVRFYFLNHQLAVATSD
jgi:hypothetical protein